MLRSNSSPDPAGAKNGSLFPVGADIPVCQMHRRLPGRQECLPHRHAIPHANAVVAGWPHPYHTDSQMG